MVQSSYASLLGRNVLEQIYGRSFDLELFQALGTTTNGTQFTDCAGRDGEAVAVTDDRRRLQC